MNANPHLGSSFDAFLEEVGIREDVQAHAIKRVIAWQLAEAMREQKVSKLEMARRLNTSRAQLDRCSTRRTTRCSSTPSSAPPPRSAAGVGWS